MKAIIMRWLCWSGKSTRAEQQEWFLIISKDKIRKAYPELNEEGVHKLQTMLDKSLDKLRDKTLSFWCVISIYDNDYDLHECRIIWNHYKDYVFTTDIWIVGEALNIIWHPLTRWRIEYSRRSITKKIIEYNIQDDYPLRLMYDEIRRFLNRNYELYNQSELERMQSPHREKLKELLIQFSNYLL